MNDILLDLIDNLGYFGMFLCMILEAVIIIIPSELILATGGIMASQGKLSLMGAFLTGLIGSVFCAVIIYLMGYFGGRNFVKRFGKYFFMKDEDIKKSEIWADKYGIYAAFLSRNFPIVRTLISLPMGISKMPFLKFILFTTLGSIPWTFAFVYVGYSLGNNWIVLKEYTSKLKVPIRILIICLIGIYIYKKIKKRRK